MENQEKKIKIFTSISEENTNEQEQFGASSDEKRKRVIEMKYSEIESQLKDNIFPLISSIELSEKENSSLKLSKVTLKLGFSIEGNIFIASGKIESAIELEFTK